MADGAEAGPGVAGSPPEEPSRLQGFGGCSSGRDRLLSDRLDDHDGLSQEDPRESSPGPEVLMTTSLAYPAGHSEFSAPCRTASQASGPRQPQISPRDRTASCSSVSSATLASILVREKSGMVQPSTIVYVPPLTVHGNEEIRPSGTP